MSTEHSSSLKRELLSIKEYLVRKAAVFSNLDKELLDNTENEESILYVLKAHSQIWHSFR